MTVNPEGVFGIEAAQRSSPNWEIRSAPGLTGAGLATPNIG